MNQGAFEANEQAWRNQVLSELRGIKAALDNIVASLRINQQPLAAGVSTTLPPGFVCASCGQRFYGNHTCIPRSSTTGGNVG